MTDLSLLHQGLAIQAASVFKEVCPSCGGTGRTDADEGRLTSYCFRCAGSGTVEFTKEPE